MSLDLSPEIENAVRECAAAEGVSVNDLLARTFASEKMQTHPPADPKAQVRALLAQWQSQDNTPLLPPILTENGETPTQALFRRWEEEDTDMTEEQQKQHEKFWEEFQQSIDLERTKTGMAPLF